MLEEGEEDEVVAGEDGPAVVDLVVVDSEVAEVGQEFSVVYQAFKHYIFTSIRFLGGRSSSSRIFSGN